MNNHLKINVMNRDFCFVWEEKTAFFCCHLSSHFNLFAISVTLLCVMFFLQDLCWYSYDWESFVPNSTVKSYQKCRIIKESKSINRNSKKSRRWRRHNTFSEKKNRQFAYMDDKLTFFVLNIKKTHTAQMRFIFICFSVVWWRFNFHPFQPHIVNTKQNIYTI